MARIIPFLSNPALLGPAVAQFGLTGLLAAGAGLLWSWASRGLAPLAAGPLAAGAGR